MFCINDTVIKDHMWKKTILFSSYGWSLNTGWTVYYSDMCISITYSNRFMNDYNVGNFEHGSDLIKLHHYIVYINCTNVLELVNPLTYNLFLSRFWKHFCKIMEHIFYVKFNYRNELNTLWQKDKLIIISNISICHIVFKSRLLQRPEKASLCIGIV